MRWTQTFIPTMKEEPADAEIPSHRLMLRAGLVRQLMAGVYTYLPLGYRALQKAERIVRQEMERAGAVELHMPALQPVELFERTGRREAFGDVLIQFEVPRGDRRIACALGPTHEEVVTDLMARHISSYRQLPLIVFQIQTKFRNEERPRFGVLRTSEFLMKDAYSFGTSLEQLDEAYQRMYEAYCRIFSRCGLDFLAVEAESGPIGGDASHEFMIPAENGEDDVVRCERCGYAANLERAETGRTLSQREASKAGEPQQVPTPGATSIEQVSRLIGCEPQQMIKTLIYNCDETPIAVLVRGDHEANEAKVRRSLNASECELADDETIRKVTGAPVGFAGPVGLSCRIICDHDVAEIEAAVVGANAADAHLTGVRPGQHFSVDETFDLRNAAAGDRCPHCEGSLELVHGIEVGHVFKLGTKYSESLGAYFLDEAEERHPIIMGCYGIGVNRIVAGVAETQHDEKGLTWPMALAPYEMLIIPLNVKDENVMSVAERFYGDLQDAGVDVLFDDRPARPGVKFKDAELIGIPLQLVIGGRGLKEGQVELKWRREAEAITVPVEDAVSRARVAIEESRLQSRIV